MKKTKPQTQRLAMLSKLRPFSLSPYPEDARPFNRYQRLRENQK
jgi:hypothetical protein